MCHNLRDWAELTPFQSLLTLSTPLGAPARVFHKKLPPAKLISTYQIRGTSELLQVPDPPQYSHQLS